MKGQQENQELLEFLFEAGTPQVGRHYVAFPVDEDGVENLLMP